MSEPLYIGLGKAGHCTGPNSVTQIGPAQLAPTILGRDLEDLWVKAKRYTEETGLEMLIMECKSLGRVDKLVVATEFDGDEEND